MSEDNNNLVNAQNEVIGVLFEVIKRLQKNIDLQDEGVQLIIKSKDECIVMVASPGAKMNVHNQNPPTSLTIFLHRAKFEIKKEQYVLPEPLYDPNSEKFIKRMTAETYDVKEGEYIQIIDTSGRQCSDYLAYDKKKLD